MKRSMTHNTGMMLTSQTVKTENGTGRNITKTVNMQMINTPKYSKYLMTNSVEICGATEMIMIVGQIREIIHYY